MEWRRGEYIVTGTDSLREIDLTVIEFAAKQIAYRWTANPRSVPLAWGRHACSLRERPV